MLRLLLNRTLVLIAIIATTATSAFADYKEQLGGRTIEVMVGFSNSGSGARFWNLFSTHMRRKAPDTRIRAVFKDGPLTVEGIAELYQMQPGDLGLGLIRPPELAFAQITDSDAVQQDLRAAHWLLSVENISFLMAGKRDLFEDPAELGDRETPLVLPVNDPLATATVVSVLLSAVTDIPARTVVGFGRSARTKALVAGDVDIVTLGVEPGIVALAESGDILPIYTIVGDDFAGLDPQIPDVATFVRDDAPEEVVSFIRSARGMGRAFFAPPGVAPEDIAALQALLEAVVTDPDFIQEAQINGIPIAAKSGAVLTQQIDALIPADDQVRDMILTSYQCGLEMAQDAQYSCGF